MTVIGNKPELFNYQWPTGKFPFPSSITIKGYIKLVQFNFEHLSTNIFR